MLHTSIHFQNMFNFIGNILSYFKASYSVVQEQYILSTFRKHQLMDYI